jgi:alcohol dehydrogenase (NADP+)
MLCGGTTVYSPLKKYGAGTTAKDVGVIGIGGLGHFALIFAKAMGANVTAISHSANKEEDAKKMGATKFIATGSDAGAAVKGHERSLDLIVCSSSEFTSITNPATMTDMCRRQEHAIRGPPPSSSPVDISS